MKNIKRVLTVLMLLAVGTLASAYFVGGQTTTILAEQKFDQFFNPIYAQYYTTNYSQNITFSGDVYFSPLGSAKVQTALNCDGSRCQVLKDTVHVGQYYSAGMTTISARFQFTRMIPNGFVDFLGFYYVTLSPSVYISISHNLQLNAADQTLRYLTRQSSTGGGDVIVTSQYVPLRSGWNTVDFVIDGNNRKVQNVYINGQAVSITTPGFVFPFLVIGGAQGSTYGSSSTFQIGRDSPSSAEVTFYVDDVILRTGLWITDPTTGTQTTTTTGTTTTTTTTTTSTNGGGTVGDPLRDFLVRNWWWLLILIVILVASAGMYLSGKRLSLVSRRGHR